MNADAARLAPLDVRPEDFPWARFGRVAEGQPWHGRTVVITGGTGFIGARLARKLALYGASVTIPTRDRSRGGTRIDPNIRLVDWNATDPTSVAAAFAGRDTLFNLAYDFRRSGESNVALYGAIADAAARVGVRRFIHASSVAVYDGWLTEDIDENSPSDGPGHAYKLAKRAMERDLEARVGRGDFDAVVIQPVNVYGPFSTMWTDAVVERIRARGVALPSVFDGLNNGVYVDDLVDAFIAAGNLPHGGARRFIVSGPAPVPWAWAPCTAHFSSSADIPSCSCRACSCARGDRPRSACDSRRFRAGNGRPMLPRRCWPRQPSSSDRAPRYSRFRWR